MKPVKNEQIMRLIERIGDHYRTNVSNRFIRPALMHLSLEKTTWDQIEAFTEKYDQFFYQGFHLDELYRQIAATARFVYAARRDIVPTIRQRLNHRVADRNDKILQDIAVNNFSFNIQLLADLLNDLYVAVVEFDISISKGKRPVYQQMHELSDIGNQLIET